jgi:hypothetical protein
VDGPQRWGPFLFGGSKCEKNVTFPDRCVTVSGPNRQTFMQLNALTLSVVKTALYKQQPSNIFQVAIAFVFQLFVKRRRKSGDFFKLIGQMRYAAVMHFVRDFRKVQFVVQQQFLDFFNFVNDDELLNGNTFYF